MTELFCQCGHHIYEHNNSNSSCTCCSGAMNRPRASPVRSCSEPPVVLQQCRHTAVLKALAEGRLDGRTRQRWLCAAHADVIDPDWVEVAPRFGGPRPERCEWEEES